MKFVWQYTTIFSFIGANGIIARKKTFRPGASFEAREITPKNRRVFNVIASFFLFTAAHALAFRTHKISKILKAAVVFFGY